MKLYEYLKSTILEEKEFENPINEEDVKKRFNKLLEDIEKKGKVINFIKPNLDIELEEIERTQKELNLTNDQVDKIKEKFKKQKIVTLKHEEIDNSDYGNIQSFDDVLKLVKKYDKDINRLLDQFEKYEIEAPIILSINDKKPYLIGGNTRLMILKLMILKSLNIKPKVLEIKI